MDSKKPKVLPSEERGEDTELSDAELEAVTGGMTGIFWGGNVVFIITADAKSHDVVVVKDKKVTIQ